MRIRIPAKKVCEKFHLTYELKGAQRGVDVLTRYYGVRRMRIIVDGRRVANGYECEYFDNKAYFAKKGFNKRNVLHEVFHHVVENNGIEIPEKKEERMASRFVREVMKSV